MEQILLVLNLVATFNGALVGLVLLVQERFGPVRTRLTLAGFLLTVSASLAIFVLLDTGTVIYNQGLGIAMDTLALVSAGLFLDYVYTSVSPRGPSLWPYTVAALYLLATLVNGGRYFAADVFAPIVFASIAFSLTALVVWLRARKSLPPGWKNRPELLRLPVLLAGIGVFHVAQLLRLFSPDVPFLFDLVPLVGALGLLAFGVYGLIGSQTLRVLATTRPAAVANEDLDHRLEEMMASEKAYLDPDLSLQKAASLLGVSPTQLSAYLNHQRGLTFRSYVNTQRINEAMRILKSPEESRTSIEAIAMMCGFRSRSSFYTAFQSQVGRSPQAYRKGAD